jgi:Flp pilus assembly protein TadG
MRRRLHIRSEEGQTMVEFAIVLPVLCLFLFGVIQFGIVFNNYITITDAARAGARKAAISRLTTGNGDAAKLAAQNAAPGLDLTNRISVTSASNWATAGTDVTVAITYPYSINILGWTVKAGNMTSTTKERLE